MTHDSLEIKATDWMLLSDTAVPDLFIADYMMALDGLAVKCYLYLLMTARTGSRQATREEICQRLNAGLNEVSKALAVLQEQGLLLVSDRGIELTDLKGALIARHFRHKTSGQADAQTNDQLVSQREQVVTQINETFFQGVMSFRWYDLIDYCFDVYRFEAPVVYALFKECADAKKLANTGYISKVAQNWARHDVKSFSQLNRYFVQFQNFREIKYKIGRKLRRTISEYDEEMIDIWVNQFGYDFKIIDLALRRTVKSSKPSIAYVHSILEEWHQAGLKDEVAIAAYEKTRAEEYARQRTARQQAGPRSSVRGPVAAVRTAPAAEDEDLSHLYAQLNLMPEDEDEQHDAHA